MADSCTAPIIIAHAGKVAIHSRRPLYRVTCTTHGLVHPQTTDADQWRQLHAAGGETWPAPGSAAPPKAAVAVDDILAVAKAALDLARKATPGKWKTPTAPRLQGAIEATVGGRVCQVASVDGQAAMFDMRMAPEEVMRANAAAIAAMHNAQDAFAALVEEVTQLRTQVCRLTDGTATESDHLCYHHNEHIANLAVIADLRERLNAAREELHDAMPDEEA